MPGRYPLQSGQSWEARWNSYRTGWAVIGNPFPAGSPLDGVNDWGGMDGDGNFAYAISSPGGIVALLTLSGLAGLQPGVYEIAAVSDSSYGQVSGTGYWATGYGPNVMAFDTSTPLRIIPEPASILLLAGALPFLRRRAAWAKRSSSSVIFVGKQFARLMRMT